MKNKLHYAPEALRDLDDIWEYITLELNSPAAAKRTIGRILDAADRLEEFAEAGAPLRSVTDVESGYRFLVCGNYLAFYRVKGNDVFIDRVLYGRRDYLRILFGDPGDIDSEV